MRRFVRTILLPAILATLLALPGPAPTSDLSPRYASKNATKRAAIDPRHSDSSNIEHHLPGPRIRQRQVRPYGLPASANDTTGILSTDTYDQRAQRRSADSEEVSRNLTKRSHEASGLYVRAGAGEAGSVEIRSSTEQAEKRAPDDGDPGEHDGSLHSRTDAPRGEGDAARGEATGLSAEESEMYVPHVKERATSYNGLYERTGGDSSQQGSHPALEVPAGYNPYLPWIDTRAQMKTIAEYTATGERLRQYMVQTDHAVTLDLYQRHKLTPPVTSQSGWTDEGFLHMNGWTAEPLSTKMASSAMFDPHSPCPLGTAHFKKGPQFNHITAWRHSAGPAFHFDGVWPTNAEYLNMYNVVDDYQQIHLTGTHKTRGRKKIIPINRVFQLRIRDTPTLRIIQWAVHGHALASADHTPVTNSFRNRRTFLPRDEQFEPLLGSPTGEDVAWLLVQHKAQFGLKQIKSVSVFADDSSFLHSGRFDLDEPDLPSLFFEIEDVPASETQAEAGSSKAAGQHVDAGESAASEEESDGEAEVGVPGAETGQAYQGKGKGKAHQA